MRCVGAITVWALAAGLLARAHGADVLMPDGKTFEFWSDRTNYTRTYHVSAIDPKASDGNPGTEALPLRTINRAAQLLQPGERVWIHAGIYREMVEPQAGGTGPYHMIGYEAAPGEQVIIKGSRVIEGRWERSRDPQGGGSTYSKKLWATALPDTLFSAGYHPFRTPNASNAELDLMPWALRWKGRIPYVLPRGLLFENGRRMQQLATYEDLVRLPGSYWVAADGKAVHIHPFEAGDPNGRIFEAATQEHLFKPKSPGLGYIRVSGLVFEQCANGFPRVGVGAVFTMGGHHWLIERNTVRHVNSVGVEFGYRTFEIADAARHAARNDPDIGHTIVRGNRIYDCGTAGMRSHDVAWGLVEDNEITECGWQDAEYHWETAAIKLLVTRNTLVRRNHIARIEAGCGIWLDWDNRGSRVSRNVIHDVQTAQAAIFIEASQQPNMVDHNVIWAIDGQGVRLADSDNVTIAHNLLARVREDLVYAKVATDRSVGGRRVTSRRNRVVNNIFVDAGKPLLFGDADNQADYNVYASADAADVVAPGTGEQHSIRIKARAHFDAQREEFDWRPAEPLFVAPVIQGCERDFAGRERTGADTPPGPWVALRNAAAVELGPTR